MVVRTAAPPGVAKHLFSVTDYHRFGEAGILSEDDRVELINGEVVEMSPIGSLHAACVDGLVGLLHKAVGTIAQVRAQNPIQVDEHTEPQPDITLLKKRDDRYALAHPKPSDVLLVIEVADTSIEYDRSVKLPLYARAEIPETWLVDLNEQAIEVFSAPRNGQYQTSRQYRRGVTIPSASLPSLSLSVDEILG